MLEEGRRMPHHGRDGTLDFTRLARVTRTYRKEEARQAAPPF